MILQLSTWVRPLRVGRRTIYCSVVLAASVLLGACASRSRPLEGYDGDSPAFGVVRPVAGEDTAHPVAREDAAHPTVSEDTAHPVAREDAVHPTVSEDAAWTWFGGPRAVTHEGVLRRTYTGWIDTRGDVKIAAIDPDGSIETQTLWSDQDRDDHSNPSILVRPDGRIIVFSAPHCWRKKHDGVRQRREGGIYYRASERPEDISAWGPAGVIVDNAAGSLGWTYPTPVQLSGEDDKIYLFWRGGNGQPILATSDDGSGWDLEGVFLETEGRRPYFVVASNDVDEIHIAFTRGHPAEEAENGIHYLKYRGGSLYRADGTLIRELSDKPARLEECDTVYDGASLGLSWVWDVAFDEAWSPVIVYALFVSDGDHRYRYARWHDGEWKTTELTAAGPAFPRPGFGVARERYYSGGITLDHDDPNVVYLSRKMGEVYEIERWQTDDGGETWSSRPVTEDSVVDNVRPVVPRGRATGDPELLWMSGVYYRYDLFGTSVRYLPGGPLLPAGATAPVGAGDSTRLPIPGESVGPDRAADSARPSVFGQPAVSAESADSTQLPISGQTTVPVPATLPSRDDVVALAVRVCDTELATHVPRISFQQQWCEAVLHMGVRATFDLTGEERFLEATRDWCGAREWRLGPRPRHADDLSSAQVYLEMWGIERDSLMLGSAVEAFDRMLAEPLPGREEWSWCDALFMAPPAMARLSEATGDLRYVEAMDPMWWDVVDHLYDADKHLFYRDARRQYRTVPGVPPNRAASFWGRGNGWVMAGTVRVLSALPPDHPSRGRYERLLTEMAVAVADLQGEDGLWRPTLVRSREHPSPDTSASSLFCCALAWGVAEGILPQEKYLPVIAAAWGGLTGVVDAFARLGWVQPIGGAPGVVRAEDRADFGTGAFLLAAREVARLCAPPGGEPHPH